MKITEIEPIALFNGYRNFLFVVVRTDSGLVGVGESGLSGRELAVEGGVKHLRDVLIGEDPFRIEHIWQIMARGAFFPATGAMAAASSAIDIALWDIKGKALNVPCYELLGGLTRDKVLCYGHVHGADTKALVDMALKAKERGWQALRFGTPLTDGTLAEPRQMMRKSIEQFGALREALGEEMEIIIDVHTRLDLPEALKLCKELEAFDPLFVEDPLRSEDPIGYRQLRAHTNAPIGAGEQYPNKWAFRPLIEEELMDYCRLDPCLCGGITESKKIAAWCEVHHIRLAVHNPIGPIATAACLHLNLSCPNVGVQEQASLPGIMPDVFPGQMEWENGYLLAPKRPGLGIELNIEAAKKNPFRSWEPPQMRRADGAVTNW